MGDTSAEQVKLQCLDFCKGDVEAAKAAYAWVSDTDGAPRRWASLSVGWQERKRKAGLLAWSEHIRLNGAPDASGLSTALVAVYQAMETA